MTLDHLNRARALDRPERDAMLRRDSSVQRFWAENSQVLIDGWADWERSDEAPSLTLDDSFIDPGLRAAVANAWNDPSTESAVRDLLHEAAPGVFSLQFFNPGRLADLRGYLEEVWDAGVALRPPYGIVLNRGGAMLDQRSEGCLGAPSFQAFYRMLMDTYMRPISRLLFPEIVGYDTQTFGFSINYQPDGDTSIRPHTDASAVTLNINLNLPGEAFTGSTVDFFDQATGVAAPLTFEPGTAMLHRGNAPHAAQPITSGERTNFVLWLYGEDGRVPMQWSDTPGGSAVAAIDPLERWVVPGAVQSTYAPF